MRANRRRMRRATLMTVMLTWLVVSIVCRPSAAAVEPAGSFVIPAYAFDRGNAKTFTRQYADAGPMIANGGTLPWEVQYDIPFPVTAEYTLHVRYASASARPMGLLLDGKDLGPCCGGVTGSFNTSSAKWEEVRKIPITQGKHTLKLTCAGAPPHVVALRLDSPVPLPKDWKLQRPKARKLESPPPAHPAVGGASDDVSVVALRAAIADVTETFGPRYPQGPELLGRLDELQKSQSPDVAEKLRALRREAMFAHPLLDFDRLLFVRRSTFCSSHIYTDHFDGSRAMGGNLCVLSPVAPDGKVTEIAPQLDGGLFGRFDLSFDSQRVVFSYKQSGGGYRIYEIGVDGSGLRQLTHDGADEPQMIARYGHGYDDMDPCYLPVLPGEKGRIMFASTRSKRTVLCHSQFTTTSLHVIDADGGNLRCISGNPVNEFAPCVMDDGRVIYTRWEYVDKGCGDVQSLWSVRPDGSASAHVFKNNVSRPATLIDARSIPDSNRLVAVGAPHMPLAVGPVVLVDVRLTQRTPQAMTNLTPEIGYPGHSGYPNGNMGYYKEPFPLSEKLFLVSYNPSPRHDEPAGYGIYLLDAMNNRQLVYREADFSCFQPIPLRRRRRPPNLSALAGTSPSAGLGGPGESAQETATLFMTDVYRGMTGIQRGRVKYVRIMEDVAKPWEAAFVSPGQGDSLGLQNPAVSLKGHFTTKRVHGVVRVYQDGSAFFRVPAERNLYFQALDEDYMELQRMRTFVNLMPGERRSCIGCHELRRQAPAAKTANSLALDRPPQDPQPQPGDSGPRMVHYATDVQPVLDRHCVTCHDADRPQGGLVLTGELTTLFNRSYENLINKKLINNIDVDPRAAYIPAEPPLTFGSHRSRMVEMIRTGPCKVELSRAEFVRLVTWIDANAPYYGTYEGKKNLRWKDAPDFRPAPHKAATVGRARASNRAGDRAGDAVSVRGAGL